MYLDNVSKYYKKRDLQDRLNNLLSDCKTKEERRDLSKSLRPFGLDKLSEHLLSTYPDTSLLVI